MSILRKPTSRADEVRARRAKDIKQRVIIASDTIKKPGRYTPIVTRDEVESIPILQQARKKTRRKFYIPLPHGAEIRLPAIPVLKPGWRLVSGLIFVLAWLGIYAMWEAPFFQVSGIKLVGGNRVTLAEVQDLAPLKGQRLLAITPDQISRVIRNTYPVLADVKVSIGLPNIIVVKLVEREPVLQWVQDGELKWISAEGIAFDPKGEANELVTIHAAGAPPSGKGNLTLVKQDSRKSLASIVFKAGAEQDISVAQAKVFMDPAMIPAINQIAKQVPKGVELVYHPIYGLGWTDPKGWKVYFGMNPNDMAAKLNMYQQITQKLTGQGIKPKLISMENLYAPYYRTEK